MIVSIVAAILFFISGTFGVRFAFFLGIFWLIFAMAEMSWEQQVFGIKSSDFIEKFNYQKEINFRNFLNPIIEYLYLIFFLIMTSTFTPFRKVQLLLPLYSLNSVAAVMKVSDKYNLFIIPMLCTLFSHGYFLGMLFMKKSTEFLELQLARFALSQALPY